MPSIYIINPAAEHASYYGFEVLDEADGGFVSVADLTTATLAGFVPEGWNIRLTDEAISPVDLDADVDFVAITGKVTQRGRMIALAKAAIPASSENSPSVLPGSSCDSAISTSPTSAWIGTSQPRRRPRRHNPGRRSRSTAGDHRNLNA